MIEVMHPFQLLIMSERPSATVMEKKRPHDSNAISSSTTLNHPSSSHPLDDIVDVNDEESDDLEVFGLRLEVDLGTVSSSCDELDALVLIPDEGDMAFLRKKVKSGATVGKRVLNSSSCNKIRSRLIIGAFVSIDLSFDLSNHADDGDPKEEPEEEEEPIPKQAPAGFAPQWIEDEEMEVKDNDDENDAEIIHPYEEADPLNRPPPSPETAEREFMNAPVSRSTLQPIPPIRQFTGTFYVGEGSSATVFNPALCKVYPLDLWLRAVEEKAEYNHIEAEYYKNHWARVSWYYNDLSGWEYRLRNQLPLNRDNAVRADTASDCGGKSVDTTVVVKDAGEEKDDEGDDVVAAKNSQPSESRGSPLRDGIEEAIRVKRERVREEATRVRGPAGGPAVAPVARECTFTGFMKCGPTQFHGTEGAVGLCRWFEKMESTFGIRFEVANGRSWIEVKQMMIDEFCPTEEVQRLEDKLRHFKLKDMNIAAYTERFNELALLCPDVVPNEKKKVELYIKGLPEIIKSETTSSKHAMLNDVVRMAHTLMEQKIQAKNERIAEGNKRRCVRFLDS
ncbi:putative reverse transcriptase domain-containing protein [Tanacetum coccineum]